MTLNQSKESREAFERLQKLYKQMEIPFRILLVEDDSRDIELINIAFRHYRVQFKFAMTGEQAVQILSENNLELCLLDLKLSGMSGVDVLKWAQRVKCPVPMVVLTGLNEHDPMLNEAMNAGAKCIVRKALEPSDVKIILGAAR